MSVGHCGNGCSRVGDPHFRELSGVVPGTSVPWSTWADIGDCEETGCFCASIGVCADAIRAEGREPKPFPVPSVFEEASA